MNIFQFKGGGGQNFGKSAYVILERSLFWVWIYFFVMHFKPNYVYQLNVWSSNIFYLFVLENYTPSAQWQ